MNNPTKQVDAYILENAGKFERQEDSSLRVHMAKEATQVVMGWSEAVWTKRYGKRLWRNDWSNDISHHITGRLAEIAACVVFSKTEYFRGVLTPDWSLYESGWNYRMPDLGGMYHVKCGNVTLGDSLSWIAERDDEITTPGCIEPIILVRNHGYLMFDVMGIWMPDQLSAYWQDPMSERMKPDKTAVYWRDIMSIPKYSPNM